MKTLSNNSQQSLVIRKLTKTKESGAIVWLLAHLLLLDLFHFSFILVGGLLMEVKIRMLFMFLSQLTWDANGGQLVTISHRMTLPDGSMA
jgi:hypothetical protein